MTENLNEGKLLFSIGQQEIIGQIHENQGYEKNIKIHINNEKIKVFFDIIKDNNHSIRMVPNFEIISNPSKIYGLKYNFENNIQKTEYQFNIDNFSQFQQNIDRIINSLQNNEIFIILYQSGNNTNQLNDQFYSKIESFFQTQITDNQNIHFKLSQIISGKTKKIIQEQSDYKAGDLNHIFSFNNSNDMNNKGFSYTMINSDKINFETRESRTEIVGLQSTFDQKFLLLTGQIRKNMNILSNLADARFIFEFYQGAQKISSANHDFSSAHIFKQIKIYQEIPRNQSGFKLFLECKNSHTVPGVLECKNLQLNFTGSNYVLEDNQDENYLMSISHNGIQTKKYSESIGFDPDNLESYEKEINSSQNLYKNKNMPVLVQEPVKFFNKIIDDDNKRIVVKSSQNQYSLDLPEVEMDAHKSYLVGLWVSNKNQADIQFQLNTDRMSFRNYSGHLPPDEVSLDAGNSDINFTFYWGIIYPYGMRNRSEENLSNIMSRVIGSLEQVSVKNEQTNVIRHEKMIVCTKKGNYIARPKIKIFSNSQVSSVIVMPIIKELSIMKVSSNELVSMGLNESINNYST